MKPRGLVGAVGTPPLVGVIYAVRGFSTRQFLVWIAYPVTGEPGDAQSTNSQPPGDVERLSVAFGFGAEEKVHASLTGSAGHYWRYKQRTLENASRQPNFAGQTFGIQFANGGLRRKGISGICVR